jgi:hypothetical protein
MPRGADAISQWSGSDAEVPKERRRRSDIAGINKLSILRMTVRASDAVCSLRDGRGEFAWILLD